MSVSNVYAGVVTLSGSCSAAYTKYFTLTVRIKRKEKTILNKKSRAPGGATDIHTNICVIQSNSHYPSRNSSEKNCYISPGCVSELLWILKHMSVRSGLRTLHWDNVATTASSTRQDSHIISTSVNFQE